MPAQPEGQDAKYSKKIVPISIGYERRTGPDFVESLVAHNVTALVDVRESAFSRKVDFRKNRLRQLLDEKGIEYFHVRSAGNPFRKTAVSLEECLKKYKKFVAKEANLNRIRGDLLPVFESHVRVAFLCYERESEDCHRTPLIKSLGFENPTVVVE
ncbi:MAG: DUF488 domain-containing protein [Acidobacteriota bacterium]|nr:MAG: DUF488 domain-containing protein [Acidobacteriota bacterium]